LDEIPLAAFGGLVSQRLTASLVALALFLACALAAVPSTALAGQHFFAPASASSRALVFQVDGVAPRAVRSAHLRLSSSTLRLNLKRVQRGLAKGALRLSISPTRRGARTPRLILRTRPIRSPEQPSPAGTGPVYNLSPSGSDAGPGTPDAPWRTIDHAAQAAGPGATVVLEAGSYGRPGTITRLSRDGTPSSPITFTSRQGGAPARILGQLRVDGDHVQVRRVLLDGPTGKVAATTSDNPGGEDVKAWIRGNGAMLADSEVRGSLWHAGIYVSDGRDIVLQGNSIHHNGNFDDPAQANLDHGIYWFSGSGRVIGNRVSDNLAYGVHLYPQASGVRVQDNHISGHGRGGVIVAEQASNNLIVGNSITDNREGIKTYALSGGGNVARDNRVWNNWQADFGVTKGLALR
jgi:parallel beta-helix repeat protein